jgi:50S ribosomal subunit-associated GTPase HflX
LGAGEIPVITALNKIDKLEDPADAEGKFPGSITISVKTGYGLDKLKILIAEKCLYLKL